MIPKTHVKFLCACLCLLLAASSVTGQAQASPQAPAQTPGGRQGPGDILSYISHGWDSLTRSMSSCSAVSDPKAPEKSVLYLPAGFAVPPTVQQMEKNCAVRVEHLPKVITRLGEIEDAGSIRPPGLLYLENPYVVPGGRFNEMYGWDSYFILRGLVEDGRLDLARDMVENFFFEIDHYGGVLNANRTYYLTRSQPPFLTSMIMALYAAEKSQGKDERALEAWLARAYAYAVKDRSLWVREPHLAGDTGLSRYYDFGDGPAPEQADDPGFYRRVARYFLRHPSTASPDLVHLGDKTSVPDVTGPIFPLEICEPGTNPESGSRANDCSAVENTGLTRDYYKGDRSMRESGFDISFRQGPYGAATHHYADVSLNSLLYKTEKDLEQIGAELGRKQESEEWGRRADNRRQRMIKYFWNQPRGLFYDYNFEIGTRSSYDYITAFYPLWAGLASSEQAAAVERNLKIFEEPGGLLMSREDSGGQWDYPYGWAPTQLLAVEGLRRYGYNTDADRVSRKFLSMVLENFERDGTIREKYNVVARSSETQVKAGYTENVIGFGWTNGVFLELLHELPKGSISNLSAP